MGVTLTKIESWFATGISDFEKYVLPFAQIVVSAIPGLPPIVNQALTQVPSLMTALEQMFPTDGSGAMKSQAVLAVFNSLISSVQKDTTGGAAKTMETLTPILQALMTTGINMATAKAPSATAPTVAVATAPTVPAA